MTSTDLVKKNASKKGWLTVAAAAGTAVSFVAIHWLVGLAGIGLTGYLAMKWFKYRAEWGLRF